MLICVKNLLLQFVMGRSNIFTELILSHIVVVHGVVCEADTKSQDTRDNSSAKP